MIVPYLLIIDIALMLFLKGCYVSVLLCAWVVGLLFSDTIERYMWWIWAFCIESVLLYDRIDVIFLYILPVIMLAYGMRYLLYMRWWYCWIVLLGVLGIKIGLIDWWYLDLIVMPGYIFKQICATLITVIICLIIKWIRAV